jgi:hypothetical protein
MGGPGLSKADLLMALGDLSEDELQAVVDVVERASLYGDGWLQRTDGRLRARDTRNVVISERELDDAVQLRIDPSMFDFLTQLAPGVVGYDVDHEGELWIPVIHAENPGAGDVGRYLDSLPTDRTVVVPNVINGQLAEMLERRGFQHTMKAIEDKDVEESLGEEAVEVWERAASTDPVSVPAMYDPDTMPEGARYLGADGA